MPIGNKRKNPEHKPYHLYLWGPIKHYSFTEYATTIRHRGRRIGSYRLYKDLVKDAQSRAVLAGYPKSRWMDLFDWNWNKGR